MERDSVNGDCGGGFDFKCELMIVSLGSKR